MKLERATASDLAHYVLAYVDDKDGRAVQIRLGELQPVGGREDIRLLDGVRADPRSIRVQKGSEITYLPVACSDKSAAGSRIEFGSAVRLYGCVGHRFLISGWEWPEGKGVWSIGPKSNLFLPTHFLPQGDVAILFEFGSYSGEQKVEVIVKGRKLGEWVFATGARPPDTRVIVPGDLREPDGQIRLTFEIRPPITTHSVGTAPDERALGVYLCALSFAPATGGMPFPQPGLGCFKSDSTRQ